MHSGSNIPEMRMDVYSFINFVYHQVAEPLVDWGAIAPESQAVQTASCVGTVGVVDGVAVHTAHCVGTVALQSQLLQSVVGGDWGSVASSTAMVALVEHVGGGCPT